MVEPQSGNASRVVPFVCRLGLDVHNDLDLDYDRDNDDYLCRVSKSVSRMSLDLSHSGLYAVSVGQKWHSVSVLVGSVTDPLSSLADDPAIAFLAKLEHEKKQAIHRYASDP